VGGYTQRQAASVFHRARRLAGFEGRWAVDEWNDKTSGETLKSCAMIIAEPNKLKARRSRTIETVYRNRRPRRGVPACGQLRQTAGATAAADAIQVSPRGIALRCSDMSEVGGKPEVPEARPKCRE
jgi:hypothetical protein